MSSGKVLLGVLAGVAAGATLGILFAPAKGSDTRRRITDKGDDYADELGHKFNDFISSIKEQYLTMKSDTNHIAEVGKAKAEEVFSDVHKALK